MIGRLIGATVGVGLLAAGALVLGFQGYQSYLKWLMAGAGDPITPPSPSDLAPETPSTN